MNFKRIVSAGLVTLALASTLTACSVVQDGDVEVTRLEFVPEHEKKGTRMVGKVMMPYTRTIPDSWYVYVGQKLEETEYYKIEIAYPDYEKLDVGDIVCVKDQKLFKLAPCIESE